MIALLLYLTSFLFVCLFFKYYLSLLRLVKQNIISPSSRGWEVQDQFSSWWRISFWLSTTFLTCSQMVCMCAHTHTHTHTETDSEGLCGLFFSAVQSQSCPTLCNPMDCSTPGFTVHHQLPELIQTQVHPVGDAIQPAHPLLFSSCFQSFPTSGSFPMSWLWASGGQSIVTYMSKYQLPISKIGN